MPEENTNPEDNSESIEITLDSVEEFDADNLSDEQKTFLEENKGELTPEQAERFGVKAEEKEEDIDDIEPEIRGGKPKESEIPKGDDDDDIDPEDEKTIGKVVKKSLAPFSEGMKQLEEIRNQNEVDSFIRSNPSYEKYRPAALKYMNHDAYKNVPAKNIMAIVASKDLQKMGAEKEREAAKKAKETQGSGGQVRTPAGGKVDYKSMSSEEFQAEKNRILQQR